MLSLATVVRATRTYAAERGCVATIGKVRVEPGGVNAIASHVTAWLDARGADESQVRAAVGDITAVADELGGTQTEESWTGTTRFDAGLLTRLSAILPEAPLLGTGAGHDAGILATAGIPTAMLFVRNPTGISHSPAEHAEQTDCHAGVAALTAVVTDLVTRKDAAR
jgi:N-carbamoyl-L-amino-acid hydrolase